MPRKLCKDFNIVYEDISDLEGNFHAGGEYFAYKIMFEY